MLACRVFTGTGWVFEPLPAPEGAGNGESHIQWPRYVPVGTLRPEAESPFVRACWCTLEGRGTEEKGLACCLPTSGCWRTLTELRLSTNVALAILSGSLPLTFLGPTEAWCESFCLILFRAWIFWRGFSGVDFSGVDFLA